MAIFLTGSGNKRIKFEHIQFRYLMVVLGKPDFHTEILGSAINKEKEL